jgi:hypothetical protein
MKSNSKEEVSRFTYQFDLERKITSRTPKWLCGRRREKERENQSKSFLESCLGFVWKNKGPCMHIYRRKAGVFCPKCNKRISLLDNVLQI